MLVRNIGNRYGSEERKRCIQEAVGNGVAVIPSTGKFEAQRPRRSTTRPICMRRLVLGCAPERLFYNSLA